MVHTTWEAMLGNGCRIGYSGIIIQHSVKMLKIRKVRQMENIALYVEVVHGRKPRFIMLLVELKVYRPSLMLI